MKLNNGVKGMNASFELVRAPRPRRRRINAGDRISSWPFGLGGRWSGVVDAKGCLSGRQLFNAHDVYVKDESKAPSGGTAVQGVRGEVLLPAMESKKTRI